MWWILGGICAGLVLVAAVVVGILMARESRHKRYVMENSEPIIGWLVQANSALYEKGSLDYPAQILITFDKSASPEFMEELAGRVAELKDEDPSDPVEAEVADLVSDETYRPRTRVKLPKKFTGGPVVYSTGIIIERELLPRGVITRPYVHCQAIRDNEESDPVMLPYPKKKRSRDEDED